MEFGTKIGKIKIIKHEEKIYKFKYYKKLLTVSRISFLSLCPSCVFVYFRCGLLYNASLGFEAINFIIIFKAIFNVLSWYVWF